MKTERIEFELDGEKHWAVLKELSFGEFNQVVDQSVKLKGKGGDVETEIEFGKYRELLVLKSIKEASFTPTIDFVRRLPKEVGELLFEKAQELNPFR